MTHLNRAAAWIAVAGVAIAATAAGADRRRSDVNTRAADGTTALYRAAADNDVEAAKRLIAAGADVSIASRYGVSPLTLAALNGNATMIGLFLKAGANPNASQPDGETALMTAARTGVVDAVKAVLAAGAQVDAKESTRGQTALMWAAAEGHVGAIRTLIAHGADIQTRSTAGWTAWLFAVREGRTDTVRALLDAGANIHDIVPSTDGRRRPGGSSQEAPSGPGALHLAVGSNHFELAAYLLERGANPDASGPGWTALAHITWMRKPGQGSNGPGPRGSGRLDSLELVRKLAARGADLNARVTRRPNVGTTALNLIGGTPFFLAARTADFEMMRVLAELGADPRLPNADGTTPLMAAAGAGTHSPGEDAGSEAQAVEAVKLALSLGNDVNAVDKNGNTAMHGAAYKQLPSVVDLLVAHGARIDVWHRKNVLGWTPLRIAVGVHRGMNFRFHEPTADRLRRVMMAAGVSTDVDPERVISGGTPTKN